MNSAYTTFATHYLCDHCGRDYELTKPINVCPSCGGLVEIQYDLARLGESLTPQYFARRAHSMWRWQEFLPLSSRANIISMGEGDTLLMPSIYAGPRMGLKRLYFKNDTPMPTGSFKDRGFSLAVSFARELGITRGLTYTSGNAGASFAAYASRAGIATVVLVEYTANPVKVAAIGLYGATVVTLHFNGLQEITNMLEDIAWKLQLYQFVNFVNPVRHEAMKTYAYEICEALNWEAPDLVIHPVGTGGGLWGAWKGFRELKQLDWINHLPRMVAVQPAVSAHLVGAFQRGEKSAGSYGSPAATIAQSIAADAPIHGGSRVLRALYESGGWAEGVTDKEILEAVRWLGKEGIAAEPSAAAPLAALNRAIAAGKVDPEEVVVCVITGSALKQPTAIQQTAEEPKYRIHANFTEFHKLLRELWREENLNVR